MALRNCWVRLSDLRRCIRHFSPPQTTTVYLSRHTLSSKTQTNSGKKPRRLADQGLLDVTLILLGAGDVWSVCAIWFLRWVVIPVPRHPDTCLIEPGDPQRAGLSICQRERPECLKPRTTNLPRNGAPSAAWAMSGARPLRRHVGLPQHRENVPFASFWPMSAVTPKRPTAASY
jgi:hypothetical protein